MEERLIRPENVWSGVNYPRPEKVARIAEAMRAHGWQGRALLVEEGLAGRLFAWTGSHRVEAAKKAGLVAIPCRIISRAESQAALDRLPDTYGFDSLLGALKTKANGGGPSDPERLEGLRRLGLFEAAAALEEEIAAEEW
jgi:hypothetical protein